MLTKMFRVGHYNERDVKEGATESATTAVPLTQQRSGGQERRDGGGMVIRQNRNIGGGRACDAMRYASESRKRKDQLNRRSVHVLLQTESMEGTSIDAVNSCSC